MRFSALRKPMLYAGIILLQAFLALIAYFFVFPALGVAGNGLALAGFLFGLGTAACLLAAWGALHLAGTGILLEDVMHSIRQPLFVLDSDDRILLLNPEAGKLLDVDPDAGKGVRIDQTLRQAIERADSSEAFNAGSVLVLHGIPRQALCFQVAPSGVGREVPRRLVFLRDASLQVAARTIAGEISQAMTLLDANTLQITNAARSLSRGATQQAQSLAGITSTMGEFAQKIHGNIESAEKGTQLAAQAREAAERSGNEIAHALTAMTDVQDAGIRIARIVKLIDDIAFQTNLLALNAAVEAARAGRQGKGFAVVADEVRNLAGRSAKAAKDTASMVEDVTVRIGNASAYMAKLEEMLGNIVQDAIRMADSSASATAKSAEQANGIIHVNQELGQVSHATGGTMSAAEQTTTSVEMLNRQMENLRGKVEELLARLFSSESGRESGGRGMRGGNALSMPATEGTGHESCPPAGGEFSGAPFAGRTASWEGGRAEGGMGRDEEFEAPFKRMAAGDQGWDLESGMENGANGASLPNLLAADGYDRDYQDFLTNSLHRTGRGKNGGNFSELFPGEVETPDGDRVVRPGQNIPLDDAEFGRY